MIHPALSRVVAPLVALIFGFACAAAYGKDYSCAPQGAWPPASKHLKDKFYEVARSKWATVVSSRYLEGTNACEVLTDVKGYETFPVIECSYSSNGRSAPGWTALNARVRLLQPSSAQLALWTVRACRVNGKTDATMKSCIIEVVNHIKGQNGAQFPIAGTVVEQHCDSSPTVKCAPDAKPKAIERRPRNAPFRDGVAVETQTQSDWSFESLDTKIFDSLFAEGDNAVIRPFDVARVAALPDGRPIDAEGKGWLLISREVHKAACRSDAHELIDALVYQKKTIKR